jgi:tRNA-2-methylthio-N6-dimethylallyladenosine synthase
VRAARFAGAFTFQYSPRPGTPAAGLPDQIPKAVVQQRYERLVGTQDAISLTENQALQGRTVDVLVAAGEGRKDTATHRMSGRAPDNRLVHFAGCDARPGDMVSVHVTRAAPHHLIGEATPDRVRRTRAGDAWQARNDEPGRPGRRPDGAEDPFAAGGPGGSVLLGLPTVRRA